VRGEIEKLQSGRGGGNSESYDTGFEHAKSKILSSLNKPLTDN